MKFSFPNNFFKISTLFFSLLFSISCAQFFTIVPSGNINEDVKFEFYKNNTTDKTVELKVESVALERRIFNIWRQVWVIWEKENSKPASLKNINYGEAPAGLDETIKPKKIKVGSSYKISVSGTLLSGETAYGIEVFHLSEDGEVIVASEGIIISERR